MKKETENFFEIYTEGPLDAGDQILACGKLMWKSDDLDDEPISSATLISEDQILTSWHIFNNGTVKPSQISLLRIVFGENIQTPFGIPAFGVLDMSDLEKIEQIFPKRDLVRIRLKSRISKVAPLIKGSTIVDGQSVLFTGFGRQGVVGEIRGKIGGVARLTNNEEIEIQAMLNGKPFSRAFRNGDSGGAVISEQNELIAINDRSDGTRPNRSISTHSRVDNIDIFN